jgi:hypothetical protein
MNDMVTVTAAADREVKRVAFEYLKLLSDFFAYAILRSATIRTATITYAMT